MRDDETVNDLLQSSGVGLPAMPSVPEVPLVNEDGALEQPQQTDNVPSLDEEVSQIVANMTPLERAKYEGSLRWTQDRLQGKPIDPYAEVYIPGRLEDLAYRAAYERQRLEKISSIQAQKDASWAGSLGFDPEESTIGGVINIGASAAAGGAKVATDWAAFNADVVAQLKEGDPRWLTQEDRSAFIAYLAGKATPEQLALLQEDVQERRNRYGGELEKSVQARLSKQAEETQRRQERLQALKETLSPEAAAALEAREAAFQRQRNVIEQPNVRKVTVLELLEAGEQAREVARMFRELGEGAQSVAYKGNQEAFYDYLELHGSDLVSVFDDENASTFQKGIAAAKLFALAFEAGAANPQAAFEMIAIQAPQLIAGVSKYSKTALAIMSAADANSLFQEGKDAYAKKHGTAPDEATLAEMRKNALMYMGLDFAGDLALTSGARALKAIKANPGQVLADDALIAAHEATNAAVKGAKATGKTTGKEAAQAAQDAAKKSFAQGAADLAWQGTKGLAGLTWNTAKPAIKTTAPFVTGGAVEGLTEGLQSAYEAGVMHQDISTMDMYKAAAAGVVTGGAIGGVADNAAFRAEDAVRKAEDQIIKANEQKFKDAQYEQFKAEVLQGNQKTILNNPAEALRILEERIKDENATPAQQQDAIDKALGAKEKLEKDRAYFEKTLLELQDPAFLQAKNIDAETAKNLIESVNESIRINKEDIASVDPIIQGIRADSVRTESKGAENSHTPAHGSRFGDLSDFTDSGSSSQTNLKVGPAPKPTTANIKQAAVDLSSPDVSVRKAAGQSLVRFAQALGFSPSPAPDLSGSEKVPTVKQSMARTAFKLAVRKALNLSDLGSGERSVLEAHLKSTEAVEELENSFGKVARDVFHGSPEFKGLNHYRKALGKALEAGDVAAARKELSDLNAFARRHRNKAKAFAAALKEAVETGKRINLLPNGGLWDQRVLDKIDNATLKERGGMYVTAKAGRLVDGIGAESKAISAVANELNTLYEYSTQAKEATEDYSRVEKMGVDRESKQDSTTKTKDVESKQSQKITEVPKAPTDASTDSHTDSHTANTREEATQPQKTSQKPQQEAHKAKDKGQAAPQQQQPQKEAKEASTTPAKDVADKPQAKPAKHEKGNLQGLTAKDGDSEVKARFKNQLSQDQGQKGNYRPLVALKDYFSSFMMGKNWKAIEFFTPKQQINERQKAALEHLIDWIHVLNRHVQESVRKESKDENFWFQDLMNHFLITVNHRLAVEENLATAISIAAYSYIAENGNSLSFNDDEGINLMLGRDKDAKVSARERAALKWAGKGQSRVAQDLGKRIVQMLGIKANNKTPKNLLPTLEMALGMRAIHALNNARLIEIRHVTDKQLMGRSKDDLDAFRVRSFVQIKQAGEENHRPLVNEAARKIAEAQKGTEGIIQTVFGYEYQKAFPALEPIKHVPKKGRKSFFGIPDLHRKAIEHIQNTKNYFNATQISLYEHMGREAIGEVYGQKFLDPRTTYIDHLDAQDSRNLAIDREMDEYEEFAREKVQPVVDAYNEAHSDKKIGLADVPFYFTPSFWAQQRMGFDNKFNPQASKVARHLFTRKEWTHTMQTNDEKQKQFLLLRIADSFGKKTDRSNHDTVAKEIEALLEGDFKQAVDALTRHAAHMHEKTKGFAFTEDEIKAIVDAVNKAGEKGFSLEGLAAWAEYKYAVQRGKESFQYNLIAEVDGLTNGPSLANFLFGVLNWDPRSPAYAGRAGFFKKGSEHQSVHSFLSNGGKDFYEINTQVLRSAIDLNTRWGETFDRFFKLATDRKLLKGLTSPVWFGSSLDKAVNELAESAWGIAIERLEKTLADYLATGDKTAMSQLNKDLAVLTNGQLQINTLKAAEHALQNSIPDKIKAAFFEAFEVNAGKKFKENFETEYKEFFETRNLITKTTEDQFRLFSIIHDSMKKDYLEGLMDKLEIGFRIDKKGNKVLTEDWTAEQEREFFKRIEPFLPAVGTYASYQDKNPWLNGLIAAKREKKFSKDSLYEVTSEFGSTFYSMLPTADRQGKFKLRSYKSVSTNAQEIFWDIPGVLMVSAPVHSLDSGISHEALLNNFINAAFNIHDAHLTGVGGMVETAKSLNEATFKALSGYNPAEAIVHRFKHSLDALAQLHKEGKVSESLVSEFKARAKEVLSQEVKSIFKNLAGNGSTVSIKSLTEGLNNLSASNLLVLSFSDRLIQLRNKADAHRQHKNKMFSEMDSIEQYPFPDGEYRITEEDVKNLPQSLKEGLDIQSLNMLEDQLEEVFKEMFKNSSPVVELVEHLKSLQQQGKDEVTLKEVLGSDKKVGEEDQQTTKQKPQEKKNTLEDFLKESSQKNRSAFIPVAALTDRLRAALKGGTRRSEASKLYGLLTEAFFHKLTDTDLKIRYVQTEAKFEELKKKLADLGTSFPERGAAVYLQDTNTIVLVASELTGSRLTPEYLVHELVHAFVVNVVEHELAKKAEGKPYNKQIVKAWEEVKAVYEYVKENYSKELDPAVLENAHEFLAYGLTNAKVIEFLKNKELPEGHPWRRAYKVMDILQRFANAVAHIFFGKDITTARKSLLYKTLTTGAKLFAEVEGKHAKANEAFAAKGRKNPPSPQFALFARQTGSTGDVHTIQDLNPLINDEGPETSQTRSREFVNDLLAKLAHGFADQQWVGAIANMTEIESWALMTGLDVYPSVSGIETSALKHADSHINAAVDMVYAIAKASITVDSKAYNTMQAAYTSAKKALINSADVSQKEFDWLFGVNASGLDKDYLARFVALASVHPQVKQWLEGVQVKPEKRRDTGYNDFASKMVRSALKSVDTFTSTKTRPNAAALVPELVIQLALQHGKRRRARGADRHVDRLVNTLDEGIRKSLDAVGDTIANVGSKLPLIHQFAPNTTKLAGQAISLTVQNRLDDLGKVFMLGRNKVFKERLGLAASIVQDVLGHGEWAMKLLRARTKMQDERQDVKDTTTRMLKEIFSPSAKEREAIKKNGARANSDVYAKKFKGIKNAALSDKHSAALTATLLRTDAASLLDVYSLDEIKNLLLDANALEQAIKDNLNSLAQVQGIDSRMLGFYGSQANGLGFYMAQGYAVLDNQLRNAHNIAHAWGTKNQGKVKANEDVIAAIDVLASLYGLKYADQAQKALAARVIEVEDEKTHLYDDADHGVQIMLLQADRLKKESLKTLFGNKPGMMLKGYTPEITNPYIEVKVGTAGQQKDLLAEGFEPVSNEALPQDIHDLSEKKYLWIKRNSTNARTATGTMLLNSLKMKGVTLHDGYVNDYTEAGVNNLQLTRQTNARQNRNISVQMGGLSDLDLSTLAKERKLIPVFNDSGRLSNYVYTMAHSVRDDLLERSNGMEDILGTLAGTLIDKPESEKQNKLVIDTLKLHYDSTPARLKAKLIWVGKDSKDPDLVERWTKLPESAREHAQTVFGKEGMWIPIESLDLITGFKKWSLSEHFVRNPKEAKAWQELLYKMIPAVFSAKSLSRMNMAQRIWEEIVKETKSNIVVKSGTVLAGNVASNTMLLKMWGVPMVDVIRRQWQAAGLARRYFEDKREKAEIEFRMGTMSAQEQREALEKISRLNSSIEKNPIKTLMDAGLMPTIADDVSQEEDPYSYKIALLDKVNRFVEKIPEPIKETGKFFYMARDTAMFRFMSEATQISDLAARFVLYEHLTQRKLNPYTHEKAIELAGEAFVNYDVPLPRALQATDDLGLTLFTKYFFRIQRVIVETFAKNPSQTLLLLALDNWIGMPEMITDSNLLGRIGNNPFESGVLEYFSTLDNVMPVALTTGLFK